MRKIVLILIGIFVILMMNINTAEAACASNEVPQFPLVIEGYALHSGDALSGQTVSATFDGQTFTAIAATDGSYTLQVYACGDLPAILTPVVTVCTRSATLSSTVTYVPASFLTDINLTTSDSCPVGDTSDSSSSSEDDSDTGGAGDTDTETFDVDLETTTQATVAVPQGSSRTFTFNGEDSHTVKIDEITATSVTITISSTPVTITLEVGQTKTVDMNGDGEVDLSVTLNSIIDGEANLKILRLSGADKVDLAAVVTPVPAQGTEDTDDEPILGGVTEAINELSTFHIIIVIIVVGIMIVWLINHGKTPKTHHHTVHHHKPHHHTSHKHSTHSAGSLEHHGFKIKKK